MKARSSLPVSIRREIEQVVDDRDHALAGSADVLHVFAVTLVAECAETLAGHHFGKADDGVERRAHLVADPRQHVGLGAGGALGQPPRLAQFALGLPRLRQVAEHREEIRAVGAGAAHGHRQRDHAALAFAAEHLAAVVEQAGGIGRLDAGEIFEHAVPAFRCEQLRQIAARKLLAVIAEQRFGAAIGGIDVALGVEHHDAVGRGVEDGGEFFGVGMADRRRFGGLADVGFGDAQLARPALLPRSQPRSLRLPGACSRRSTRGRNRRPMKSCRGGRRPPAAARRRRRAGSRKSSPACRCPRSRRRSIRPVRHRARRGRRHLPAHAGSDSPSAPGTPGWHTAAGRAGRSGCRREADRAAPCRAWLRRARAVRAAPAIRAARRPARAPLIRRMASKTASIGEAGGASLPFSVSSRADNCRASSLKAVFSTGVSDRRLRFAGRAERHDVLQRGVRRVPSECLHRAQIVVQLARASNLPWGIPRAFPNRFV